MTQVLISRAEQGVAAIVGAEQLQHLLGTIAEQYGYDFRDYAQASLNRRIRQHLEQQGMETLDQLTRAVSQNRQAFFELLRSLSVPVTEMFRDPDFFRSLAAHVLPRLATFPFFRIWHAGCATGEEAWSMAVLLDKTGILDRAQIYATDYNEEALAVARKGIYDIGLFARWQSNYQQCGLTGRLEDYCWQRYRRVRLDRRLQQHIVFANHNLVTDRAFGEMELVLCRNVLIYFNRELQERVLMLLRDSLRPGGFLCLGPRETLRFSAVAHDFEVVDEQHRIYRRVLPGLPGKTP